MVEIPDDVARSMGRALRGQDTLDLKVALEYADLLDPPKPPPDEQDTESTRPDGIDMAWGLIANAYGGNWELASDEWRKAAERWRDENLKSPPLMNPTLVEQMVEANANLLRTRGEAMTDVLAVVRAEIQANWENWDGLIRLDRVLDLLGGGTDG